MKQTRGSSPRDKKPSDRRRNPRSPIRRQTRGQTRGQTRPILQSTGLRGVGCDGSIDDCLRQLEHMVPTIRTGERLNGFEILQRVIEYILILEEALGIIPVPESDTAPCSEQRQMLK